MCLTEYNEAETMEMFKQEAREEGMSILVANMLNDGRTIEEVADICHLSHERVKDVADNLAKHLF